MNDNEGLSKVLIERINKTIQKADCAYEAIESLSRLGKAISDIGEEPSSDKKLCLHLSAQLFNLIGSLADLRDQTSWDYIKAAVQELADQTLSRME